jgi:hypothetical protein
MGRSKEKGTENFSTLIRYSDSSWVGCHVYIGLRACGRGFADLCSLEAAIENNVSLEIAGNDSIAKRCYLSTLFNHFWEILQQKEINKFCPIFFCSLALYRKSMRVD